jgi:alkaline phosphatase D
MKSRTIRWYDLFDHMGRHTLTRRDFLEASRAAVGILALGALPARRGDWSPRFRQDPFGLGVASGDPRAHGVVLWTKLLSAPDSGAPVGDGRPVPVAWEVASDEGFRTLAAEGTTIAVPELGHAVHAEVETLRPDRMYWYRFHAGGITSPVGRTRTAPEHDATVQDFRFGFTSCQHFEQGYYTALRHLADEDLRLVVHLGDYIYENGPVADRVRLHSSPEVFSLMDYRARYAQYKSDPDLQAAHAAFPWVVTPDDHEVDNNYADHHAENAQTPEELLLRRAAAYQAYYEHMPLRRSAMPAGPSMHVYRRLRFGRLVELSVLDTRQYRTDQPCGDGYQPRCEGAYDPDATMMGLEQEVWLFDGMARSNAIWNVLANQVLIAQLAGERDGAIAMSMDKWDGYVVPRARVTDFLNQRGPANPVVLTGDIHSNWVADLKTDFDDPGSDTVATELVCTSISSGGDGSDTTPRGQGLLESNPHVKFYNGQRGYVRCAVSPTAWTADYRVVPYVSRRGAPIRTRASFTIEEGTPGARPS